jgi:WD40 repeat protein
LEGHTNNVREIRFSSDNQYMASCSTDKTALVWHVETGSVLYRFEDHSDTVNDVVFARSGGSVLATCSADKTVKLWDISTGALLRTLQGHSDTVNQIQFSSTGQMLVSCSADTTIRLWNLNGTAKGILKGHTLPVNSAAISPDGKSVVSCSDDGSVRLWDVDSSSIHGVLEFTTIVRTVRFSNCGQYVETDRGVIYSGMFFQKPGFNPSIPPQTLFATRDWVKKGFENIFWLPDEYRATSVATEAQVMVLGHSNGGISFLHF